MGISINKVSGGSTPVVAPYKVFTGLVTQNGGSFPSYTLGDETINVGISYTIDSLEIGDNLIPYGAPNNDIGTIFICNQDVSNWGNPLSQLSYNTGAPTVTILENTIGNVWFTYVDVGHYSLNSLSLFTNNKTWQSPVNYALPNDITEGYNFIVNDENSCNFLVFQNNILQDGALSNTPIEIRVYN